MVGVNLANKTKKYFSKHIYRGRCKFQLF